MGKHEFAKSFRDLIVYQKARSVSQRVFVLSKAFPCEERYSLTDQGRRSSRSVGAQIAEAWAKRRYPNHFASKLTDADGEQNETQHWIETAVDCEYLKQTEADVVIGELQEVGRMLGSMISRADDFKGDGYGRVHEDSAPYGSLDEFFG
ncbi:MAG: four helix bundle protein [Verrucomicrobia bacterium]|jgi:four helix bundle protein|nr:four helix bundle protein [Verrucomicrobiota bacterium]